MERQLELLIAPDVVQGGGGQYDLPSAWPDHTLISFTHDTVKPVSSLVLHGECSAGLRADMMVSGCVAVITAELANRVTIDSLL